MDDEGDFVFTPTLAWRLDPLPETKTICGVGGFDRIARIKLPTQTPNTTRTTTRIPAVNKNALRLAGFVTATTPWIAAPPWSGTQRWPSQ